MDAKREIRDFLTSRRARLTPEEAGLRTFGGGARRVPGLRREEVALLAGVSVDYYTRLERGNAGGASESVLHALARALHLDDAEREHLFALARAAGQSAPGRRRRAESRIRPTVQLMLDAMTGAPAFVRNGRGDLVAANRLGRALYAPHFDGPFRPANSARFLFLDPRAETFYLEWSGCSGPGRTFAGTTRASSASTIRSSATSPLTYESLELAADPGPTMFVYTAEPGSRSAEALGLLASWAATADEETVHGDHEEQPRHRSRAE